MSYSKQDLLDAIDDAIDEDEDFAQEIQAAIESKDKSWLRRLIEAVAREVWGYIKSSFIGWIFGKLF